MNHLVAYDAESDEDSPRRRSFDEQPRRSSPVVSRSPNRRRDSDVYDDDYDMAYSKDADKSSSTSERSERDTRDAPFLEPPPPKRPRDVHSPSPALSSTGMPRISSTASLVAYGGDETKEDGFEQAEREGPADRHTPPSSTAEPRPPERVSRDSDSDEDNERLIDQVLEEGMNTLKEVECGSAGGSTPAHENDESPKTPIDMDDKEEEGPAEPARIPPAPDTPVDPVLQAKLEILFEKKAQGVDFNRFLQKKREFLNPSCYESFIERFGLDEKGSNFRSSIFDPHAFPENCYYDSLHEAQKRVMESQKKPSNR